MTGYTKLFGSILDSTVWLESTPTKVVWITMLAMADRDGTVEASVPGLAKRAGVAREECEQALALFLSPDPDSRTQDHEGRRIAIIEGGWHLLNYDVYRERASAEEAREKAAARKRRQREREERKSQKVTHVTPGPPIAEAPAPASAKEEEKAFKNTDSRAALVGGFTQFWSAYPKKKSKGDALKVWNRLKPDAQVLEKILDALRWQSSQPDWAKDGGRFIPYPATWLNVSGWEDEPFHTPQVSQKTVNKMRGIYGD